MALEVTSGQATMESEGLSTTIEAVATLANLQRAWDHVRERGSSPGIDRMTVQAFARGRMRRLKDLSGRLLEGAYRPSPGMRFSPPCDPERKLVIPTVEDRIVQRAVANVLGPFYARRFSDASCAYRPGRSVRQAHGRVVRLLADAFRAFLRTDIASFFDTIERERLVGGLAADGHEPRLVKLVRRLIDARAVEGVAFIESDEGIPQGSALSPLLSNVYLTPVDDTMTRFGFAYLRYADDILVLGHDAEECADAAALLGEELGRLGLRLSARKTRAGRVSAGFDFLGRRFDHQGAQLSRSAHRVLNERASRLLEQDASPTRLDDFMSHWEDWYGPVRRGDCSSMALLSALVRRAGDVEDDESLSGLAEQRLRIGERVAPSIHLELFDAWASASGEYDMIARAALAELRVLLEAADLPMLEAISRRLSMDPADVARMQRESDVWAQTLGRAGHLSLADAASPAGPNTVDTSSEPVDMEFLARFVELVAGDCEHHLAELEDSRGHLRFRHVPRPIDTTALHLHAGGTRRCGVYLRDESGKVRAAVIHVRARGKNVRALCNGADPTRREDVALRVRSHAQALIVGATRMRLSTLLEETGALGCRIWFLFATPISQRHAFRLLKAVVADATHPPDELVVEREPATDTTRKGRGPFVWLPFGRNPRSNRSSRFLDAVTGLSLIPSATVHRITRHGSLHEQRRRHDLEDVATELGDVVPAARDVIDRCSLLSLLVHKARRLGHLEAIERASLFEVFGHLRGADAGEALAIIMRGCDHGGRSTIDRRLSRLTSHPAGAVQLDQGPALRAFRFHLRSPPASPPGRAR